MPAPSREMIIAEIRRVEREPGYAKSTSQFRVSQQDAISLLAFSDAIKNPPPPPLPKEEKAFLQNFLENALGNMALNHSIDIVAPQEGIKNAGMAEHEIRDLRYFTYKTRNFSEFDDVIPKMKEVNNALQAGAALPVERRLTLREYGLVSEMAKTHDFLDGLNRAGLLEGNKRLTDLYQDSKVAKDFVTKLESEFKASVQVQPGTIAFDNSKKKTDVAGATMSFFETVVDKAVTKHGHVSKLYLGAQSATTSTASSAASAAASSAGSAAASPAGSAAPSAAGSAATRTDEVKKSHIDPTYDNSPLNLGEFLYADTYRINLENLISAEDQKLLEQKFPEGWLSEVNGQFKDIERSLHDREVRSFRGVRAAEGSQKSKAGLAAFTAKLGYKQFDKTDFSDIHSKMFTDYYRTNNCDMLCSEFVAKTTIATITELNQKLRREYGIDHDIIKIPIGAHENLEVMHPDRFLAVLKSKGCVERVGGPYEVSRLVKKDSFELPVAPDPPSTSASSSSALAATAVSASSPPFKIIEAIAQSEHIGPEILSPPTTTESAPASSSVKVTASSSLSSFADQMNDKKKEAKAAVQSQAQATVSKSPEPLMSAKSNQGISSAADGPAAPSLLYAAKAAAIPEHKSVTVAAEKSLDSIPARVKRRN